MTYSKKARRRCKQLRFNGRTINEICEMLGIAKSTASLWCKELPISENGARRIERKIKKGRRQGWERGLEVQHEKYAIRRRMAFKEGGGANLNKLDLLALGLYWGEGHKSEKRWGFTNSDVDTVALLVRWAIRAGQPREGFAAVVRVHEYDDISDKAIIRVWSRAGIPKENITVCRIPRFGKGKHKKLPYGTCALRPKGGLGPAYLYSYLEGQLEQARN